jgi:hypothetical protein
MLLPSNTTHVLQPLDVGVYGPLKQAWKKILAEYKLKTRAANTGKEEFLNFSTSYGREVSSLSTCRVALERPDCFH